MLKRGPFSFISYELVKESKGIIFSAKIASFFTGFEGRKRVVFYCTFTGFEGRKRVVFYCTFTGFEGRKKES
jgi:hypothetical protein